MREALSTQESAACRKSPPTASFSECLHCFPLGSMSLPGGKQCKETLLRKASESAAHVAGFGLHLEGYGPPNLPEGFFDSLLTGRVAKHANKKDEVRNHKGVSKPRLFA